MKFKNNKAFGRGKNKRSIPEKVEIKSLEEQTYKVGELDPLHIKTFDILPLSSKTQKGLKENGFEEPTKVQCQSLIHSLRGLDVIVAAKTGSGKTLAFLIPLLENLYRKLWNHMDGLGALIITPTRELAYQIFEVLNKVGKHHCFSAGLIIGGKDLKFEWNRVSRCNIIICTPGRILQHMTENPEFNSENVQLLILDEADQCLSMGFADAMNAILCCLPSERQTLLFSATQTRDVNDLIRAGCKNPVFCSVHEHSKTVTPKTLKESYVLCEEHEKITFLWSFLKHHKCNKILVFLSTCKQVKYMFDLFVHLRPGLTVMCLYGDMHQLRRMAIYDEFCQKKHAVLFATDVAARGLDIPSVDWVIQLDCPEDVTTYIHRAGRTARHKKSGEALLVLTSSQERSMISILKTKSVIVDKIEVDQRKLQSIHLKVEATLTKFMSLKEEAVRAFKSYLKNISLMKNKDVFDITSVDIDAYARSLGLVVTPRVRFIERKLKSKSANESIGSVEERSSNKNLPLTTLNLSPDDDNESDDDFLVSKTNNGSISESEKDETAGNDPQLAVTTTLSGKKKKVITKYAVVKKLLKKNVQLNKKVTFDEDGEPIVDPVKQMTLDHSEVMLKGGIDIAKMGELLRAEDKFDKKRHAEKLKEKHRKQKEKERMERKAKLDEQQAKGKTSNDDDVGTDETDDEESEMDEDTQAIIDDLPDPDVVYGRKRTHDSDDEVGETSSDDSNTESNTIEYALEKTKGKHVFSGKKRAKERAKAAKRCKLAESNELSSIPVGEKEDLALFLLKGGK